MNKNKFLSAFICHPQWLIMNCENIIHKSCKIDNVYNPEKLLKEWV